MEITMSLKSLSRPALALAASFVALQATAQTTLPANLQADRATIQQDQTAERNLVQQLRTDESAGNSAAAAADRTGLRLAHMQSAQDMGKLHQDAQAILQPDEAALTAALTQLYSAQQASNTSAVQADQAAVAAAETQLRTDREAIFGDLGHPFDRRHEHHHG
jgi:hypothetical protein